MRNQKMFYFDTVEKLLAFYAQEKREYRCICCGHLFHNPHPNTQCGCTKAYYNTIISNRFPPPMATLLGEGNTPLLPSRALDCNSAHTLYFKHEGFNPTGSFKDREAAWLYTSLQEQNIQDPIAIVSSGNAAISASIYSRLFGYACSCYASKTIASEKIHFLQMINPRLYFREGSYEAIYEGVCDAQRHERLINITSGQLIDKEYGNMGIIREIYNSGVHPDVIVAPAGNGALIFGLFAGVMEQLLLGKITKLPHIIAVQMHPSPLYEALKRGEGYHETSHECTSIADAIIAKASYCSQKALLGIALTQGQVIEVKEEQIRTALRRLLEEGYLVEPSSATVVAALETLEESVPSGSVIVSILTGSGLKVINTLQTLLEEP